MAKPMMPQARRSRRMEYLSIYDGSGNGGSAPRKKPRRHRYVPPASSRRPVVDSQGDACAMAQDPFSGLPDECVRLIFSFLPLPRDRCSCAAVSRRWLLLQAHMEPAEFRCTSDAAVGPLPSAEDSPIIKGDEKESRYLDSCKASDARLASMAVGACAVGALTDLTISANFFLPPPGSMLLGITDVGLKAVATACPMLRRITLWLCNMVGNEGFGAIARSCPLLEELYICHAPLLSDHGLIPIAMNCPKLSILSLSRCPLVGDATLRSLSQFSSNLASISLDRCLQVTDAGLKALFSSQSANLSISHPKVGSKALMEAEGALGRMSPIRKLCLENLSGLSGQLDFRQLLLTANQLESLSLRSCAGFNYSPNIDPLPPVQTQHVGLRHLELSCYGDLADLELLLLSKAATHLESLRLQKCHRITIPGVMDALRNWSATLKSLSLVECNGIQSLEIKRLEGVLPVRCPLLQSLEIKRCPGVGDEFLSLMGTAMAKAKRLEVVGTGTMITDRGIISLLASVGSRVGVHTIDLRGCPMISDWTVAVVVSSSGCSLRHLVLNGCLGVTDCSLRLIGLLCPALVDLDLTGCCRISDSGVAALLTRVRGGSPAATEGAGIKRSRLEVLSLEGCEGITDECLRMLEEMVVEGSLLGLNLKRCGGISRAGVDAVRKALWWCDLIY